MLRFLIHTTLVVTSIALVAFVLFLRPEAKAEGLMYFRHGVALFHPMISATIEPGSDETFVFPPYGDDRHRLTPEQLTAIRGAGFDFVRLPTDPGPFLEFHGTQLDAVDDILRTRVAMILNAGLGVIVDFHPRPLSVHYKPSLLVEDINAPLFQSYCAMVSRTAGLLAGLNSDRVAFELMNEPPVGWSRVGIATWQAMAEKLYRCAHNAAPHLKLVMTGGSGGSAQGLLALDPTPFARDPNVIFTFHYYDPYQFTMQSEKNSPTRNMLFDVPYPASARPLSDSLAMLSDQLDKKHASPEEKETATAQATQVLTAYEKAGFDRSHIKATFDQVAAWAVSHGIAPERIFLGEFGVIRRHDIYQGARDDERTAWLHDVSTEAENHHFFWSIWAYSGTGGMEISDGPDWTNVDPLTLKALGLPSAR